MMAARKHSLRKNLVDFSFLVPALFFVSVFVVIPIFIGLPIAFQKWDGFSPNRTFIGLKNFQKFFNDKNQVRALLKTLEFTVWTLTLTNVVGLLAALFLNKTSRFDNILRTAVFMPFTICIVLSSYIFSYIYSDVLQPYLGLLNPLTSKQWVIFGLAMIAVWRDSGYCMIVYFAALQAVPNELYESARIEGAGPFSKFFKITLPMIVPALTANLTLILSWGLKVFDYPMVATVGGPGNASETMNMLIYRNIFVYYKAGYGQASAYIFTVLIFILTAIVSTVLRKREVEL